MNEDYIKHLSKKYSYINYTYLRDEYLRYKAEHIDKLSYVNEKMLKIYQFAFFKVLTAINKPIKEFIEGEKESIFKAAFKEVKNTYKPRDVKYEVNDDFICNLYRIKQ